MAESKFPPKDLIESIVKGKKDFEEVKKLLEDQRAELLDKPIDDMETYLVHKAAREGNMNLVQYILEKNPDQLKFHKEMNGADVLQHAIVSGNLDLVKFLISKGADVHYRYHMDVSCMYFIVKYKHFEMLKYFIEELKFDPNEVLAANGIQPLYMSMEHEDKNLFDYILSFKPHIENIGPHNFLAFAARLDDEYFINSLLDRGAPFEIMEPYDRSAFSWAGEDNRVKTMETLLKRAKGVKPEALLAPGISKISHEFNSMCDKWWRLYDIYMLKYFTELKRGETEQKGDLKKFLEDPALTKLSERVSEPGRVESLIFKVPRNIFRGVIKYLDIIKVDIKVPDPQSFNHLSPLFNFSK